MIEVLIDKLTNSIEEVVTGRTFPTDIALATLNDLRRLSKNWNFDWRQEAANWEVYKLTVPTLGSAIHGLMSLERRVDHVYVNLLESHPENVGRRKKYVGVPGNLMAFAARLSQDLGHQGCVAFEAKSALFSHYTKTLGAHRIGRSQLMIIDEDAAVKLIEQYFGGQHGYRS